MPKKNTVWYTLGEAEKASGVPRTRLDHACRVHRLEYRRSEAGARLLSHDVVEKLRKQGLRAFPRPYDPDPPLEGQGANPRDTSRGSGLAAQHERIEHKRGEIEEMRVNRDLRLIKDQERQERDERRSAASAEQQMQAERRAQEKLQRRQLRLEEASQAEVRTQARREAEGRERRKHWEMYWLEQALQLIPSHVPHQFELVVHKAVAELLPGLNSDQPDHMTLRLIQAAIEKAVEPWWRQKEVEKIIQQARDHLPALAKGWSWALSEWDARAMRAAGEAVAQLGGNAPLAEVRAAAVEAGKKVCAEYEAWKASEDHRRACEDIVQWVFDGEEARDSVRQALEKLQVGTPRHRMEAEKEAALAPFRAAKKAAADADRYLQHISEYVSKLGSEETGGWDLGDWFERYQLTEELKVKLRPLLIQKLSESILGEAAVNRFIEDWVDGELEVD